MLVRAVGDAMLVDDEGDLMQVSAGDVAIAAPAGGVVPLAAGDRVYVVEVPS